MIRRNRIQVKPNLAKAGKAPIKPKEEPVAVPVATEAPNEVKVVVDVPTIAVDPPEKPVENVPETENPVAEQLQVQQEEPVVPEVQVSKSHHVAFNGVPNGAHGEEHHAVRSRRLSLSSHAPTRNRTNSKCEEDNTVFKKPERLKFTGNEELNTAKFRMMDLVFWNPKSQEGLKKKDGTESCASSVKSAPRVVKQEDTPGSSNAPAVSAPQVKISADGKLVIDEASLLVKATTANENIWETVEEGRNTSHINSLSFRKKASTKGATWSEKETDLFYEILRCTGPDFGIMHEFLPTRSRNELKQKYNREERHNWGRICAVTSKPCALDETLYDRCAQMQEEMKTEKENKKKQQEELKRMERLAKQNKRLNEKEKSISKRMKKIVDDAKKKSEELDQLRDEMKNSMRDREVLSLYEPGEYEVMEVMRRVVNRVVWENNKALTELYPKTPAEPSSEGQEQLETSASNNSQPVQYPKTSKFVKEAKSIVRELEIIDRRQNPKRRAKKKEFTMDDYTGGWTEEGLDLDFEAFVLLEEFVKTDEDAKIKKRKQNASYRQKRRQKEKEERQGKDGGQEDSEEDESSSDDDEDRRTASAVELKKIRKAENASRNKNKLEGVEEEKTSKSLRKRKEISYVAQVGGNSSDEEEEEKEEEEEEEEGMVEAGHELTTAVRKIRGQMFNAKKTDSPIMSERRVEEEEKVKVDKKVENADKNEQEKLEKTPIEVPEEVVEPPKKIQKTTATSTTSGGRMVSRRKTRQISRLGSKK